VARARGTAGAAAPRPFEQGDLDGLCGVYAVVNAARLAAHPHRRLRAAECRGLFAALLEELADEGRLRGFVAAGLGNRVLARLLRRAGRWLRKRHGLALEVRRPFSKADEPDPDACLRALAEHLARPGTAAIVGSDEHWTVVRAVTPRRLLLADNDGRRHFATATVSAAAGTGSASRPWLPGMLLLQASLSEAGRRPKAARFGSKPKDHQR
jgi:hypothetical protein